MTSTGLTHDPFDSCVVVSTASVVSRSSLARLSSRSASSLKALVDAAVFELTTERSYTPNSQQIVDQQLDSDHDDVEALAAMCAIIAACAKEGDERAPVEQRCAMKERRRICVEKHSDWIAQSSSRRAVLI